MFDVVYVCLPYKYMSNVKTETAMIMKSMTLTQKALNVNMYDTHLMIPGSLSPWVKLGSWEIKTRA